MVQVFPSSRLASSSRNNSFSSETKIIDPLSRDGSRNSSLRSVVRFGQSIRRVVREVEERGSVDEARDVLVQRFVLLTNASRLLGKAYTAVLNTLVNLQNDYLDSKAIKNIFLRYSRLRRMVKIVCSAERCWLPMMVVAEQNRGETLQVFVVRVAELVVQAGPMDSDSRKPMEESLNAVTSKKVAELNSVLFADFHRILKKYQAVRKIVCSLTGSFCDSKMYPIFPRYILLRDMIKTATRHPDFKESRHEATV